MSANRPLNINLYISNGIDDDEAERLAAILSEALDAHGFPRVLPDPEPVRRRCSCAHKYKVGEGETITADGWTHSQAACFIKRAPDPDPDPEPVPQWRASVDAARRFLTGEDPLVTVLRSLACVPDDSKVTDANLARIVAVCESQVGGGWQAEPTPPCELGDLLFVLADVDGNVMWREIGEAAAAWLRDITEATS